MYHMITLHIHTYTHTHHTYIYTYIILLSRTKTLISFLNQIKRALSGLSILVAVVAVCVCVFTFDCTIIVIWWSFDKHHSITRHTGKRIRVR